MTLLAALPGGAPPPKQGLGRPSPGLRWPSQAPRSAASAPSQGGVSAWPLTSARCNCRACGLRAACQTASKRRTEKQTGPHLLQYDLQNRRTQIYCRCWEGCCHGVQTGCRHGGSHVRPPSWVPRCRCDSPAGSFSKTTPKHRALSLLPSSAAPHPRRTAAAGCRAWPQMPSAPPARARASRPPPRAPPRPG